MGAKFKWLLVKRVLKYPEFFQGLQLSSNLIGRNRHTNETGVDRPHSTFETVKSAGLKISVVMLF